ncbi:MAG: MipA/OmpV family protein [Planctomycetes bacterium]|nr:MipA/OmpV family protein [Planctomycetota bacterium]
MGSRVTSVTVDDVLCERTGRISLVLGAILALTVTAAVASVASGAQPQGSHAAQASSVSVLAPGSEAFASDRSSQGADVRGLMAALHGTSVSRGSHQSAVTLSAPAEESADAATAAEAPAEEATGDWPSVSFDLTFNSKYVWRGMLLTDDPVFQPSVNVEWKGFTVNVWGNMDLTSVNRNEGDFNEVDVSVDYSMSLVGPLGGSVGMVFYTFPNTRFASTTEFYAGLNLDVPLSPSVTAYFDVDEAEGVYLTTDIGHSFELPQLAEYMTWSIDLSLGFGWGSGDYNNFYFGVDGSGWTDFHTSVGLPIGIGEHVTITPAISYYAVLDDALRAVVADDDNVVYGLSVTFSF